MNYIVMFRLKTSGMNWSMKTFTTLQLARNFVNGRSDITNYTIGFGTQIIEQS